jgi:SAM-dependent methyltransferase
VTGFEELVAEAAAAPVEGWDFSWFEGRATEERPPWGYARLMGERMARAHAALDIETGGGEVLATVARPPALLVATEGWRPNVDVARARLRPLGARVVAVTDAPTLPFTAAAFDLVASRHPVVVLWPEIARVLCPGGTYLSQQIGPGTNRELTEFMMGPRPVSQNRSAARARAEAESAGLDIVRLRECALQVEFCDVGAVVHFLRKVRWTVPDFTPEAYAGALRRMHERIERDGPFVSTARRLLVEARRPA